MNVISFSPFGYEGALVSIEVDLRRGIPLVEIVGLADNAVKEARERMRAAIRNSGFEFPLERVLISLSPADVKKEGAGFDLAIALAVLQEKLKLENDTIPEQNDFHKNTRILVMGELELSGRVRPVRGVHAALSTSTENGIEFCVIPEENAQEAAGLKNIRIFTVKNLQDAYQLLIKLHSKSFYEKLVTKNNYTDSEKSIETVDFCDCDDMFDYSTVKGQGFFLRSLQVAAAGLHNLIAYGPPGCGKTLALQHFQSLLPLLTVDEALPVTRIYSIAGKLIPGESLLIIPPFRMPHQSSSLEGMIGGGPNCRPGEISLAHNGILFLDEASEFKTSVLQALRVPLEDGRVTLSRAGRSTEFPARFQLLIASNPCPCGNFGSPDKVCLCSARAVEQYWRRFSAPLLDRIDIRVSLGRANLDSLHTEEPQIFMSTKKLREDIRTATIMQRKRQNKANSYLSPIELKKYCIIDDKTETFLNTESLRHGFSARGLHACIKVARTLADMSESDSILFSHMQEAVHLHKNEGGPNFMF